MTDNEQEIIYNDQELIDEFEENLSTNSINKSHENTSDEQKTAGKRAQKGSNKLRQPRQKFCSRWQLEFPWVIPDKINQSIGYCAICRRELVCKKSHLERHQRSFKHMRLQGFENVTVNEAETELIESHTSGYLDNDNDNDNQFEELLCEEDDEHTTIKIESTSLEALNSKYDLERRSKNTIKKRFDHRRTKSQKTSYRNESSIARNSHSHYFEQEISPPKYAPLPRKDSFDLFFESISASVKNLPPKLAVEVKSKVSQVITEFEIRAICEKEAEERAQEFASGSGSTQVTNVLTLDPTVNNSNDQPQTFEGGVTHYVYTYQPKMQ